MEQAAEIDIKETDMQYQITVNATTTDIVVPNEIDQPAVVFFPGGKEASLRIPVRRSTSLRVFMQTVHDDEEAKPLDVHSVLLFNETGSEDVRSVFEMVKKLGNLRMSAPGGQEDCTSATEEIASDVIVPTATSSNTAYDAIRHASLLTIKEGTSPSKTGVPSKKVSPATVGTKTKSQRTPASIPSDVARPKGLPVIIGRQLKPLPGIGKHTSRQYLVAVSAASRSLHSDAASAPCEAHMLVCSQNYLNKVCSASEQLRKAGVTPDTLQATTLNQLMDADNWERMQAVFRALQQLFDSFQTEDGSPPVAVCDECARKLSTSPEEYNMLLDIIALIKHLKKDGVVSLDSIVRRRNVGTVQHLLSLIDEFIGEPSTS